MHTRVFFILSLVLLGLNTSTATSLGHQLVPESGGGAASKCIDKERQALLDFKYHLQEPNAMLSTWRPDEEDNCCEWWGVTCNNQSHVTELRLNYLGLEGEITFSLLNLSYLNYLDLSSNSFNGTIPHFIGNMTRLTFFNLGSNRFIGTIPISIGSLTQLTYLFLGGNQFTGTIPISIGSLTQLTYLYLGANQFTGTIPRSIGSLTKLKYLDLSDNSFYGAIPPEFGNLTNLEYLRLDSLGSCTIENLDWLSSLSYLKCLYMNRISLKANYWVNVIIGLQNLKELTLIGCDLSQVMHPYSLSVNSSLSLRSLHLNNNNLNSSMYRWLCPLLGNKIIELALSPGNALDGKLSYFLSNLSECTATLTYFDASSNQLTGSLSEEIQHFSSLYSLNLSSNQLDGTISDKLWQLPGLHTLDLSSNYLKGVISDKIGKSSLAYIDLSNNSLEGAHSSDGMSNLSTSVVYIDFSSNKLGPRFPKWIKKLKCLGYLDISKNSISDTVSTKHWNQWESSQLRYLDLSFNNICGTLPESSSFHDLHFLDLSRNKFHGGISFLCQISENFEFLDVSHNSLTRQLPDCLKHLAYLKVLSLGHNTLSGSIPPSIGCLGQLETLSLYNNSFSGELPLSLKNCTKLSLLDLGANKLYGNIPVWIGKNLSSLYALSLKSNNFSGTIPSQICQLASLQILDLSFNNLHGTIPSCVNSLTSMVQKGLFLEPNAHYYQIYLNLTYSYYGSYSNPDIHGYVVNGGYGNSYSDNVMISWQGKVNEFSSNLGFVKSIDLSSNSLTGQFPYEITNLRGLVALNLSHNTLLGEIPKYIGQMKELETLDLSKNNFSGGLPSSMSQMNFLSDLDVSYNKLSGRIPSSTQLQSFSAERFTGNTGLCGLPTTNKCPGDEDSDVPTVSESESDAESTNELKRWFYIGGATGFATAFWIACSALLFNRRLRNAFFLFHNSLKDWVYVKVAVFIARLQRVARA